MRTISFEDHLTKRLGPIGTPERDDFERELHEWEEAESNANTTKLTHEERTTSHQTSGETVAAWG